MEDAFERAVRQALGSPAPEGIGTLAEKSLHRVLKYYYEPDDKKHEQPVGGFFADILNADGVTEIQTGSFFHINKKLGEFLKTERVTLICPVIRRRRIIYIDGEGELSKPRVSPKKGRLEDVFLELVHILPRLADGNLVICVPLVDADEYRLRRERVRKFHDKGYDRVDTVPTALISETVFITREDYLRLLPDLPEGFTVKELASALKLDNRTAQAMCRALTCAGALKRDKVGRGYLYKVITDS